MEQNAQKIDWPILCSKEDVHHNIYLDNLI